MATVAESKASDAQMVEREELLMDVLISIRAKHCGRICRNEKKNDVRTVWPKQDTPFRCFIYCAKDEPLLYSDYCGYEITDPGQEFVANGKVIAEFTCSQVCAVLAHPSFFAGKPLFFQKAIDDACLTQDEVEAYAGDKDVGGLVITDLKVYDKPRYLDEFRTPCKEYHKADPRCGDCEHQESQGEYPPECACNGAKPITRPPQNWCYVEEYHGY